MRHHLHAEQWLPYPLPPLFDFFANPHNLPRLADPAQRMRIEEAFLNPPPPSRASRALAAGEGSHISLSFRPIPGLPIRLGWQLEIVDFDWNSHFADIQRHGPFAFWQHTHSFAAEARGIGGDEPVPGTLLSDDIDYQLPAGALGNLAQPLVQRKLEAMFHDRHQRLAALLKLPPQSTTEQLPK
jgi:ligand-binding SRPBCC domain-containing protein